MKFFCLSLFVALWMAVTAAAEADPEPSDPATVIGVLVTGNDTIGDGDAAILRGVERALSEWEATHPDQAGRIGVLPIRARTRWEGQTSDIVEAIVENRVPVVIGAHERNTAHLAGQVVTRFKGSVLLLAVSEDATLTRIGVPWMLRFWKDARSPAAHGPAEDPDLEVLSRDAAWAVFESIRSCGPGAPQIRNCLAANRFTGESGAFTFSPSGERVPAK